MKNNNKWLEVIYDTWITELLEISDIRTRGLNKFKWFKCNYITKENVLIHVHNKWYITFWPCNTLDSLRFPINILWDLLMWEKNIVCPEKFCDSWIWIKKEIGKNYLKNKTLEKIFKKNINKVIKDIKLDDIQLEINNRIKLLIQIWIYTFTIFIEKNDKIKRYYFLENNIWYDLRIKDNNNKVYNINEIDSQNINLLNKNIKLLSKLDTLYKKII